MVGRVGFTDFPEIWKAGDHREIMRGICVIITSGKMLCSIINARLLHFPNENKSLRRGCLETQSDICHHVREHGSLLTPLNLVYIYYLTSRCRYVCTFMCYYIYIYSISFFRFPILSFIKTFPFKSLYGLCIALFSLITTFHLIPFAAMATNHSRKIKHSWHWKLTLRERERERETGGGLDVTFSNSSI